MSNKLLCEVGLVANKYWYVQIKNRGLYTLISLSLDGDPPIVTDHEQEVQL